MFLGSAFAQSSEESGSQNIKPNLIKFEYNKCVDVRPYANMESHIIEGSDTAIPIVGTGLPCIIEKKIDAGVLTIKIITPILECSSKYGADIEANNDIINLKFMRTGMGMFCDCAFGLTYKISGATDKDYKFQFEGEDIKYTHIKN